MPELIELKCRNCGSQLTPDDISERIALARCTHCNALFALPEAVAPVAKTAPIERPEVALPKRFIVERTDHALTISWRWYSPAALGLLFFAVFWNGFMIVWHGISLSQGAWFMSVFGLIHTAVGVGLAYTVATKLFNRTVIHVSDHWLQVRVGPIPARGRLDLQRKGTEQLYCTETVKHGKNGSTQTYSVEAVLDGNHRKTLIKGLESSEQAIFIEQQIETYLDIDDVPVAGEYDR